ncbi:S1/P1 nuclease [Ravibacter arvi]|uniref:S1/P1 nuclease n=1 Tax=Ravibacter arvi TaxID=2051041 RepID=A0ABP8LSB0_9BACT
MAQRRLLLILTLLLAANPGFAWGLLGHRIVGEIAQNHLSGRAKREIRKILGNESLAMSANWADFIKSDTAYRYLNNWHYVNIRTGTNREALFAQLESDSSNNVYNRLHFLVKELKTNHTLSRETKKMYLRLIVHLVGDMHQPMHVGRPDDLGGNKIQLHWFYEPSNLHKVWDEDLINYQQLSYTEYTRAIDFSSRQQRRQWQAAQPGEWLFESFQIAEQLYAGVKKGDKLRYDYNFKHIDTLNDRLLKGGIRLAGLLNGMF